MLGMIPEGLVLLIDKKDAKYPSTLTSQYVQVRVEVEREA